MRRSHFQSSAPLDFTPLLDVTMLMLFVVLLTFSINNEKTLAEQQKAYLNLAEENTKLRAQAAASSVMNKMVHEITLIYEVEKDMGYVTVITSDNKENKIKLYDNTAKEKDKPKIDDAVEAIRQAIVAEHEKFGKSEDKDEIVLCVFTYDGKIITLTAYEKIVAMLGKLQSGEGMAGFHYYEEQTMDLPSREAKK